MKTGTATQQQVATHLGLSLKGARNMLARLQLDNKTHTLDHIRKAYIVALDEVGESRTGQLDVSRERLKLMKVQTVKTKLETKIIRNNHAGLIDSQLIARNSERDSESASDAMISASNDIDKLIDTFNDTFTSS